MGWRCSTRWTRRVGRARTRASPHGASRRPRGRGPLRAGPAPAGIHGAAWRVPVNEYWAGARPLVASHHYLPYLESIIAPDGAQAELDRFARGFDPTDIEIRQNDFVLRLRPINDHLADTLWAICSVHSESDAGDLASVLAGTGGNHRELARTLLEISPYSAVAMACLVENDWDAIKGEIAAWRAKVRDHPVLLRALGKRYFELKRYSEAEDCLARYSSDRPIGRHSNRWPNATRSGAISTAGRPRSTIT